MSTARERNICRGFGYLTGQPAILDQAEEARDMVMERIERHLKALRARGCDVTEFEQRTKLLRLRTGARWWLARSGHSAPAILASLAPLGVDR